jgi:hypothetical protein
MGHASFLCLHPKRDDVLREWAIRVLGDRQRVERKPKLQLALF